MRRGVIDRQCDSPMADLCAADHLSHSLSFASISRCIDCFVSRTTRYSLYLDSHTRQTLGTRCTYTTVKYSVLAVPKQQSNTRYSLYLQIRQTLGTRCTCTTEKHYVLTVSAQQNTIGTHCTYTTINGQHSVLHVLTQPQQANTRYSLYRQSHDNPAHL